MMSVGYSRYPTYHPPIVPLYLPINLDYNESPSIILMPGRFRQGSTEPIWPLRQPLFRRLTWPQTAIGPGNMGVPKMDGYGMLRENPFAIGCFGGTP